MNNARVDEAATLQRSSVAAFIGEKQAFFSVGWLRRTEGQGHCLFQGKQHLFVFSMFSLDTDFPPCYNALNRWRGGDPAHPGKKSE